MSETWIINENPTYKLTSTVGGVTFNINFSSNSTSFTALNFPWYSGKPISGSELIRYYNSGGYTYAYGYGLSGLFWHNVAYRTVTFETSPTGDLLTWLQANAVKQEEAKPKILKCNNKIVSKINEKYPLKVNDTLVSGGLEPWFNITVTATNITPNASNPTKIYEDTTATLIFNITNSDYKTPTSMPSITGATGTWNRVSDTECRITLSNPTADVTFSIAGTIKPQLSAPTSLTSSGSTVTFTQSKYTTGYKVYVDNNYYGEVQA